MEINLSPLRFTNRSLTNSPCFLTMKGTLPSIDPPRLQYKKSSETEWSVWTVKKTLNELEDIILYPEEYVEIKAIGVNRKVTKKGLYRFSCVFQEIEPLNTSAILDASGNIMSLCYEELTQENTLIIPEDRCFVLLFSCMIVLRTPPELPATKLKNGCYSHMFSGCISLLSAPVLPATELAEWCYSSMFSNTSSFLSPPELPALKLDEFCYYEMFKYSGITVAPSLPANELAFSCYSGMFSYSHIKEPPSLPSTCLAPDCYNEMFMGCSSLLRAPELNAPYTRSGCYCGMFIGCEHIDKIIINATYGDLSIFATDLAIHCAPEGVLYINPRYPEKPLEGRLVPDKWKIRSTSSIKPKNYYNENENI